MNYKDKTADQIISNKLIDHSSWHFFQASSWLDLAKRTTYVGPLHYAAFELRYGIEYLLFQLLVLTKKELTESDYKECLGNPKKMSKMLKDHERPYKKLSRFTELANSLILNKPNILYWDLSELFKYWGTASEFLHFVGAQVRTYNSKEWNISAIAKIEGILEKIWGKINKTHGIGLFDPDLMKPQVRDIWFDYLNDKIKDENVINRLKLIAPLLANGFLVK